jgi:hypothetical protein
MIFQKAASAVIKEFMKAVSTILMGFVFSIPLKWAVAAFLEAVL